LRGVAEGHLLGAPVHPIGQQNGASQAMVHKPLPGGRGEVKLQFPPALLELDLLADQFLQVLDR
jgi:hypothetical protein